MRVDVRGHGRIDARADHGAGDRVRGLLRRPVCTPPEPPAATGLTKRDLRRTRTARLRRPAGSAVPTQFVILRSCGSRGRVPARSSRRPSCCGATGSYLARESTRAASHVELRGPFTERDDRSVAVGRAQDRRRGSCCRRSRCPRPSACGGRSRSASPTRSVRASASASVPSFLIRYTLIDCVHSQSIGVVVAKNTVSMMPENRATPKPGPQLSVSMRPGCGPRGVAKSTPGADDGCSSRRR